MSSPIKTTSPKRSYADVATPPPSPRASEISNLTLNDVVDEAQAAEPFPPLPVPATRVNPLGK